MLNNFKDASRQYWALLAIIVAGVGGALFANYFNEIKAAVASIQITQPIAPYIASLVAIIIALGNPSWQAHIWGPRLRVEIAMIERKLDQNQSVINLGDIPQYDQLNEIFSQLDAEGFIRNASAHDDEQSKNENSSKRNSQDDSGRHEVKLDEFNLWRNDMKIKLTDIQEKLNKLTLDINKFTEPDSKFEKSDIYEANRKYDVGLNIAKLWGDSVSTKSEVAQEYIALIVAKCRKMFDMYQSAIEKGKYFLQQIDYKYDEIEKCIWETKSLFYISATIINSGRNASAIKSPALLWIDLGSGRHADLELVIENFKEESEVRAGGVRVAVFKSPLIEALPVFSRELVNRYWNQALNARLLIQDINSRNYASKGALFASGLYQRDVYEKLLKFADENRI